MSTGEHVFGSAQAPMTLLEFGDFGCPHCAAARMPVERLVERLEPVRLVWRHYFDTSLHPGADLAAEASEAAAAQGAFWPMHRALLGHHGAFDRSSLRATASSVGLDLARFENEMEEHRWRERVESDLADATDRGVTGTPAFFINDQKVDGAWPSLRTVLPAAVDALSS